MAPENTLASIRLALRQGADFVENDIMRTKDGKLVITHDLSLERTTDVEQVFPDRTSYQVADYAELGGLAKGRPLLATIVMVVGMLTLAVPGSANFAGEFSILAGVFAQGWGYAAVGAAAIVLAAVYTLRLISGVLHQARGEAVREESLDLRLGELVLLVPLVAILLALSVWPAAISERSFPGHRLEPSSRRRRNDRRRVDHDPRGGLARALAGPRAPRSRCDLPARRRARPRSARRAFSAAVAGSGFVVAGVLAAVVFDRSPEQQSLIAESMTRDRLAALTQILVAGFGIVAVLVSWGDRRRDHIGEYYALLAAAGGGMTFFVSAENLMTLFLALEWFSIALYILVALDTHRKESLEAGLKYLIVGSFGSAILLFGSALTYGATGSSDSTPFATQRARTTRCSSPGWR